MTKAAEFPALRAFFRGYLHEDWPEEYRSAVEAAEKFLAAASAPERTAVAVEAERAIAELSGTGKARASREKRFLRAVGGAFAPESPAELHELLGKLRRS